MYCFISLEFLLLTLCVIISELIKPTSTVSTPPKYIEPKPRKPVYKEKPKKFKQPRRKETVENKNEEHELSTLLLPEYHDLFPTFTTFPSTTRPWIVVHTNSTRKLFLDTSCSIIVVVTVFGFNMLFLNVFILYF